MHFHNGHGRNEICRLLQLEDIHISQGSVGNIIRAYRRQESSDIKSPEPETQQPHPTQHEQHRDNLLVNLPLESEPKQTSQVGASVNNSRYTDNDIIQSTEPPLSPFGGGHEAVILSNLNSTINQSIPESAKPDSKNKSSGAPLNSFFFIDASAVPAASRTITDADFFRASLVEPRDSEDSLPIKEKEMQADKLDIKQTPTIKEAASENEVCMDIDSVSGEEDLGEANSNDVDWDSDDNYQSRFWRRIIDEKIIRKQQRQELNEMQHQLEEERQQLAQLRQNLDSRKCDLEAREIELERTTPLAKQLQAMKIDITNFMPWAEYLHEYSITHNIDLTTAAFEIVKNLTAYKELKVLENSIEKAQRSIQQLQVER
jgi:hypothetical protein